MQHGATPPGSGDPAIATFVRRAPRAAGFAMPAEWEPHRAVWTAWPADGDLWQENLAPAQAEFAALCRAIVAPASKDWPLEPESLEVLVGDARAEADAAAALAGLPVRFHRIPYGDIWLRDTAPCFVRSGDGEVAAACFRFNGWGGKYAFEDDIVLAHAVRHAGGFEAFDIPLVFEGGSLEVDGQGTAITTAQCLLNPNRNPDLSREQVEALLHHALGIDRLLWLGDGLLNDHTDGHVDTLVRFAGPGRVLCMEPRDRDDPNREALEAILRDLASMRDALGRSLEVVTLPSPGLVEGPEGEPMPASYANFYVSNTAVVVPVYGSRHDDEAVQVVASCFPGRRVVGSPARAILSGGGAFHCITQQEPAGAGKEG